jgi:hypothetical protein
MKRILTILLCLLFSIIGYSQNGGQYFENNVIIVKFIAYSNGEYIFSVINKQECTARIRTKADQDPAVDVVINAGDSVWVSVPRPQNVEILFRAKAETFCVSNPDMGWLEVKLNLGVLDLTITPFIHIYRESNIYKVILKNNILKSEFPTPENQIVLIYDGIGNRLFYQKSFVRKQYEIDISSHLKPGLNFIRVVIENRQYSNFLFKVVK